MRAWSKATMIFLDTETTGLDENAEIVQVGIIDSNENVLLDCLIKPVNPCPEAAMRIHGITNDDLKKALSFDHYFNIIKHYYDNYDVGIYNADYDARLLNQSHNISQSSKLINPFDESKPYCLMTEIADTFYNGK